jgi:NAD(P)-dependent dehydrogenase (short-subunit alcohol dehydrogenase family)
LIIAGRSVEKLQESIDELKSKYADVDYRLLQIDLSNQQSVRTAAAEVLSWSDIPAIDIVVNSAGVMFLPERTINKDGIELTFATNHVGHFLLANLIMPKLIKAAESNPHRGATRVINVSSGSPTLASMRWSDRNFEKKSKELPESERPNYELHKQWGLESPEETSYIPLEAYSQSKVANVLFSIGLTNRLFDKHGILSLGLHPGVISTELSRHAQPSVMDAVHNMMKKGVFAYRTQGAGSSTTLVAALDPSLGKPEQKAGKKENYGAFLSDCQISDQAQPLAVSSSEAEKLWKLSEDLVGQEFSY